MKITKNTLKRMIKEELEAVLSAPASIREWQEITPYQATRFDKMSKRVAAAAKIKRAGQVRATQVRGVGAAAAAELGVHAIDSMVGPELKKLIAGLTGTSAEEIAKIPDPTLQQRLKKLVSPVTGLVDLAGMGIKELRLALAPERNLSGQEKGEREFRRKLASEKETEYTAKAAGGEDVRLPTSSEMTKYGLRPGTKMARMNESKTMNITKKQLTQIILEELENVLSEEYYASAGFMRKAPDIAARGLEMWLRVAPDGAAATDQNKERALKIAEEKIRELVDSRFGERADADEIYKSIELLPRKIAMAMLGGGA